MHGKQSTGRKTLTDAQAERFFARASEIDARGSTILLDDLRAAALEAGLSPEAVSEAATEVAFSSQNAVVPRWVSLSLSGIPNRAGAHFWYQLLCIAGLVCAATTTLAPQFLSPRIGFAAALWFFGCSSVVSGSIRWMERSKAWDCLRP